MAAVTRDIANYLGILLRVGGGLANPMTPLFDMCASLGNLRRMKGMSIPMSVLSTPGDAAQTVITEAASGVAQTATNYDTSQLTNIMQIMQVTVDMTAVKEAASGEREGVNMDGEPVFVNDIEYQITEALSTIKRNIEYSMINGTYVADGGSAVASKTRGLLEAITSNIELAAGADISVSMLNNLLTTMSGNGAKFSNPAILCGDREQAILNALYGFANQSTTVGGTNIKQIWTSKGLFQVLNSPIVPAGSMIVTDLEYVKPSFMPLPNTIGGNQQIDITNPASGLDVAVYDSSSGGASIKKIVQTVFGLNYSNEALHGKITGLKTA